MRLCVTGLGLVTSLGAGVEATWTRLVRGDRAIEPIALFDASGQRASLVGQVRGSALPGKPTDLGAWSRTSAMAVVAAGEALRNAAVDPRQASVGLVVGGTTGGMFETEELLASFHANPDLRESPLSMLPHPLTSVGDCLHARLGPFSRVRTLSSACSSGANAVVVGASWLLAGDVDVVLAGGSDGIARLTLTGFNALAAIDKEPCRPFDGRRRGTNLGEGAAFLVLERSERARARGAKPVADLVGWALGAEAHHITNPAPDGVLVASLVQRALEGASLGPSDIDYVHAHGTGTPLNDAMEAVALASAFGAERKRIPISSSKGQIGHTLGAAGAIGAAIAALVVQRRTLVPTVGLEQPDAAFVLVHVPRIGRRVERVRAALSNAFGFGGMDTVLVFAEAGVGDSLSPRAQAVVITGAAVLGPCGLVGVRDCATLPEKRFDPTAPVDPDDHLDEGRARRLDRASRLGTIAVQAALADAGGSTRRTGVILGSAYGNIDGCAAFLHRAFEKGARAASPAEFPNLVPSSAAGHVSIYLGLRGPVLATADLAASGESAFVQSVQLVAVGQASQIVAGASEERSDIVDRVLCGLFAHTSSQRNASRCDLAAALVVESESDAKERGARVVARVGQMIEWRDDADGALASLRAPLAYPAEVVLARVEDDADILLGRTPWMRCSRSACAPALGESDGLGAVAIAVAAGRIATGRVREALVLGLAKGRGFAIVLAAP